MEHYRPNGFLPVDDQLELLALQQRAIKHLTQNGQLVKGRNIDHQRDQALIDHSQKIVTFLMDAKG